MPEEVLVKVIDPLVPCDVPCDICNCLLTSGKFTFKSKPLVFFLTLGLFLIDCLNSGCFCSIDFLVDSKTCFSFCGSKIFCKLVLTDRPEFLLMFMTSLSQFRVSLDFLISLRFLRFDSLETLRLLALLALLDIVADVSPEGETLELAASCLAIFSKVCFLVKQALKAHPTA